MKPEHPPTGARPWSSLVGTLRGYAIFTLDAHGVIDGWNAGVEALLGYEEHEFVGRHGSMIFTPEDRARGVVEQELAQARERGEAMDDRWHLREDGTRLWVNGVVHCVRDEAGAVAGYLKIMRDQTERRTTHDELEQQRALVDAVLASLPGVFYMIDGRRLVRWNDELERATGYSAEELVEATADDVAADPEAVRAHVEAAFRTGRASLEGHLRTKDGTLVPYLFTGQRVALDDRTFVLGVGVEIREQVRARRLLERRAAEQAALADLAASTLPTEDLAPALELAARRVAATLGAEHVHVVEFGEDGAVVHAAVRARDATGEAPDPAESARCDAVRDGLPDDAGHWPSEALAPSGLRSGVLAPIRGHGRAYGLIEALSEREGAFSEEDVRFLRSVAYLLARAIEENRLHREITHRADHDDLTGLPTRVAFERRLEDALARAARSATRVAVLFLDLDRFKNINDSLGHQAGDAILRDVAVRIRGGVRSWDVVARLGGDEFVLYLPDIASNAEIAHVTTRLLEAFEAPFTVAGRDLAVRTTIGIATFPDDGEDVEALLRAADMAMYEGKLRGRNTFHFFTRAQNEKVRERLDLETDLRQALERDEFEVVYQPQIDLHDGAVRVAEALLRWRHPRRGNLPPKAFLPVAEAIGLAVPIGERVLRRALADHAAWRGLPGAPERLAVNVAPSHFVHPSFPDALGALVREAGAEPHEVEIEFTEETLLRNPELVADHLRALRELGVRIVVDDFGTSASPLARLRALPIDRLKIDETFTHHLDDAHGRRLVEAIVQVALGLGIEPVAEGIETPEQHRAVRRVGFRAAQGRLHAAPRDRDELLAFLRTRAARGEGRAE